MLPNGEAELTQILLCVTFTTGTCKILRAG